MRQLTKLHQAGTIGTEQARARARGGAFEPFELPTTRCRVYVQPGGTSGWNKLERHTRARVARLPSVQPGVPVEFHVRTFPGKGRTDSVQTERQTRLPVSGNRQRSPNVGPNRPTRLFFRTATVAAESLHGVARLHGVNADYAV